MVTTANPVMEFPFRSHQALYKNGKWIDVQFDLRAARNLRATLLELAYVVSRRTTDEGYLVLVEPDISEERLQEEWAAATKVLRQDVWERLTIVTVRHRQYRGFPTHPDSETFRLLVDVVQGQEAQIGTRLRRPDYHYVVLKLLIHEWLTNQGPRTTDWIVKTAGCSYPTAAGAIDRLGGAIRRSSDRRVELDDFPYDEWGRLIAVSDQVRSVLRYTDVSGKPRKPDDLLSRLQAMDRNDIAVGGVLGALHHHPELDILGNPRLDLSVHCPGKTVNLDFVERLDPALHPVEDPRKPAHLVLHFVRHRNPLFERGRDGILWADPVECLLDLHEARLEPQALEFLNSFLFRREKAR